MGMNRFLILSLIFLLHSYKCHGAGTNHYSEKVALFLEKIKNSYIPQTFDQVMEPGKLPDINEDKKTLIGIDLNSDGVRDDLEIFINRNFKNDYERENLKSVIRRAQKLFLDYEKMTDDQILKLLSNNAVELSCLDYATETLKLPISNEFKEFKIHNVIYNTNSRLNVLNKAHRRLVGRIYGDGHGDKDLRLKCIEKIEKKYMKKRT